ncbi:hypothetical protein [Treponema ruminis]|uniref:Energy-coupling factor transporter ATP-binding protein EcfA2 n=1 Tax=Treponema ruminis TaxID=744515 RepID=A0A7W8LLY3_9SPIR|nr:hypothetical protein [Treponema ruminis]MBB5225904.1 energy-coupling factor transporter ATP-binding protein EcfA2 [Treponema ruminis]
MSNLEFLKKQAKNFLKDWKTQTKTIESDGFVSYHYDWKFYNVKDLFFYYGFDDKDEEDINLARAQHIIAKMVGFRKWNDLIHASKTELELAELLLRRFKTSEDIQDWEETLNFAGISQYGTEAVLDYARQYYKIDDNFNSTETISKKDYTEPTYYLHFLEETFPDKQTRKMFEFFIASILAHDDKPRKAAFFVGDTATGKSTMINVLNTVFKNMIGVFYSGSNSLNMTSWDNSYLNKWAMVGHHIENKISGKFFDIFTRTPSKEVKPCFARMIIQGNFMPYITGDKSRYDSVLVIPFEHQIKRENYLASDDICKKIETEVPSIIMRYANLYIELRDKLNGVISESELSKLRKKEYMAKKRF